MDTNEMNLKALEERLVSVVALKLETIGFINAPFLNYLLEDQGIFEEVYLAHMIDPQVANVRFEYDDFRYYSLLACHALGAGIFVTLNQPGFKKAVADWDQSETQKVKHALSANDPYELAIKSLRIELDSPEKKHLDEVCLAAVKIYINVAKEDGLYRENLKVLMRVMYDAGVTIISKILAE